MTEIKITTRSDNNGKNNEDEYYTLISGDRSVLCVADGVGGTDAGEIASGYVIKNLEIWAQKNDINSLGSRTLHEEMCSFAARMHEDLATIGGDKGMSMGTTMVIAFVGLNNVMIENIGDSRAYVYQRGYLKQITVDQTARMYELCGGNSIERLDVREKKKDSTLMQCIGDGPCIPEPARYNVAIDEDVDILLCSDGLSNKLNELNIQSQLAREESGDKVLDSLIALAKKRGERDNITAVLYRRRRTNEK